MPPINVTLLVRAAGLVVVVAAVLLALRPVSKIVRTAAPAPDLARIRVISSAGDSTAAAVPVRLKRQSRLPQVAAASAPAPVRAAVAAPPPAAPATPPPAAPATPPADHAMAFAPEPAAPTSPALIATVHAVPVFAPDAAAKAPAAAAQTPLPAPRPTALADRAVPPPVTAAAPAAAEQPGGDALVREARRLIAKGQLSEGRDLLKRAVAAGDSHAATILAKTYDPSVLKVWHVKGATVDPAEARRWYEKAKELGSPAAKAALEGAH